jgi:hypothetical protein
MSQKLRVNVHVNPSELLEADQNVSLNIQDDTRYEILTQFWNILLFS